MSCDFLAGADRHCRLGDDQRIVGRVGANGVGGCEQMGQIARPVGERGCLPRELNFAVRRAATAGVAGKSANDRRPVPSQQLIHVPGS